MYLTARALPDPAASRALTGILAPALAKKAGFDGGEVAYLPNGKPVFTGEGFLSVSHTAGKLYVAVSRIPVGLDAEARRPVKEAVKRRWFCEEERAQDFFFVWTAKEAVAKWDGRGLSAVPAVRVTGDTAALDGAVFSLVRREEGSIVVTLAAREIVEIVTVK